MRKPAEESIEIYLLWAAVATVFAFVAFVCLGFTWRWFWADSTTTEQFAQIGDSFGFVNAAFSAAGVVAVALAFFVQIREFRLSQRERTEGLEIQSKISDQQQVAALVAAIGTQQSNSKGSIECRGERISLSDFDELRTRNENLVLLREVTKELLNEHPSLTAIRESQELRYARLYSNLARDLGHNLVNFRKEVSLNNQRLSLPIIERCEQNYDAIFANHLPRIMTEVQPEGELQLTIVQHDLKKEIARIRSIPQSRTENQLQQAANPAYTEIVLSLRTQSAAILQIFGDEFVQRAKA